MPGPDPKALGRLERVELRNIWLSESSDFTPWLARAENLSLLGDALGIDLQLEAQEKRVGPFRADILCKDIASNAWVLIENQLERTDHTHLGQLLTYASGLEAVTIVWIAASFTEEHRSTLDWLNRITDDSFNFFGLEVELWRVGDSAAAPKFNMVCQPNNWTRSVAQAARAIDDAELSETRLTQRAYWEAFHNALTLAGGPVSGNRKARPQSWMAYSIGRVGFNLGATMVRPKRLVRTELYISGSGAKALFQQLRAQQAQIEAELGYALDWEELPDARDARISACLVDVDPEDTKDWPRQHEFLVRRINDMHRVFANRVRALQDVETGV